MSDGEGRAGEEAARLVAAAQGWLRDSAPHLAPVGEDGQACSCPLCRAVVGLRDADPDAVGRWVGSATALATAALTQVGDLLASTSSGGPSPASDADADAAGQQPATGGPDEGADNPDPAGQDGQRPRGVRRIPLERDSPRAES